MHCDYVVRAVMGRREEVPGWIQGAGNGERMTKRVDQCCQRCGDTAGPLKVYRDPFGEETAPGRWPTLTMHSDCFLAYIGERRGLLSTASR